MAPVKLNGRRHDDVDLARDRSLVERCQAGDEHAFEDLYLRYRDRLFRACLRRTGNSAEAEDLVQETFARAWKALPNFSGERRFYPWLSVIANNLCTDHARRGRRCTPVEESSLDLLAPVVDCEQEDLVERQGNGAMLEAALGRLSPRHREVLELREGRNWTYQEIAAHAGVEVSTIETLLFRARRSLKREFMTIAKAETGVAGLLALPLVALRKALSKTRHLLRHATPAKLAGAVSQLPVGSVVGGVAVAATAAAVSVGAVAGAHLLSHKAPLKPAVTTKPRGENHSSNPLSHQGTRSQATTRQKRAGTDKTASTSPGTTTSRGAVAGRSGPASTSPLSGTGASSDKGAVSKAVQGGLRQVSSSVSKTVKKASGALGGVVPTSLPVTVPGVTGAVSGVSGAVSGVSGVTGAVSGVGAGAPLP
jgi:RNA polymerase sigma-70 factor (ECF subfamily)